MPNLPEQLLNTLGQIKNFDLAAFTAVHDEDEKITSIRLNPFKKTDLDLDLGQPVPWNSEGFYLTDRPSFTLDPLFHAGCYYVQEPGSMFMQYALESVVDFKENLQVLDISAAPGGKSTLLDSLLNKKSLLVANEIIKSRAEVLSYNLSKWGTSNSVVTNNDPSRFSALGSFFDVLVLDAPCSGSGLFRKQPDAIGEWSPGHVQACSVRQKTILADILGALREDGILFYSTCSYSFEENEMIVEWLQNEHQMEFLPLKIKKEWGIIETAGGYRFYPHLTKSEGFFCAVLRKKSGERIAQQNRKIISQPIAKFEMEILQNFLPGVEENLIKINDQFHLLNAAALSFMNSFSKQLYFKKAGTVAGEIKGKDLVPNHELALSLAASQIKNAIEVDKETALKFLRKENLKLPDSGGGFTKITHHGFGLGWAKILPNRVNNYLPNEFRILK